ncbi:MAG: flavodoxin [Oscillospiraceae bacterium]|nr:flavodoxin [Oscillospiraceae bacterium]MDD4368718.1 flavodoxin [Oscillospiraceae bacterium]
MQVYYFSRSGRSKTVAEQLAKRGHTTVRLIDDHHDWSGKANYLKAAALAVSGKGLEADYEQPDPADPQVFVVFPLWAGTLPPAVRTFADDIGRPRLTVVVTSLWSKLRDREGFKQIIDLVGKDIHLPDTI